MKTLTIQHNPDSIGEIRLYHHISEDTVIAFEGEKNGHEGILKVSNETEVDWLVSLPLGHWLEENSPHPIEVRAGDKLELNWTVDNDSVDWQYSFFQQIT